MTDCLTKKQRSYNMSRIKSSGTRPEEIVYAMLRRHHYKVQRNVESLPGKPDFLIPTRKTAIFVHGCFWHRHKNCKYATTPQTNQAFWLNKFQANATRDKRSRRQLKKAGFKITIIWECQLRKDPGKAIAQTIRMLRTTDGLTTEALKV